MKSPIVLPFPDKGLSPNARTNWHVLAAVKQQAREAGYFAAKATGLQLLNEQLQAFIKIVPPDRRGRDDDNILASLKAYRDGIFDALKINDNQVKLSTHGMVAEPVQGGAVYVWLEPLAELPEWMKG